MLVAATSGNRAEMNSTSLEAAGGSRLLSATITYPDSGRRADRRSAPRAAGMTKAARRTITGSSSRSRIGQPAVIICVSDAFGPACPIAALRRNGRNHRRSNSRLRLAVPLHGNVSVLGIRASPQAISRRAIRHRLALGSDPVDVMPAGSKTFVRT